MTQHTLSGVSLDGNSPGSTIKQGHGKTLFFFKGYSTPAGPSALGEASSGGYSIA